MNFRTFVRRLNAAPEWHSIHIGALVVLFTGLFFFGISALYCYANPAADFRLVAWNFGNFLFRWALLYLCTAGLIGYLTPSEDCRLGYLRKAEEDIESAIHQVVIALQYLRSSEENVALLSDSLISAGRELRRVEDNLKPIQGNLQTIHRHIGELRASHEMGTRMEAEGYRRKASFWEQELKSFENTCRELKERFALINFR